MKCEIIRDLLPLYIDGLTSEESNQQMKKHLCSCGECAALERQMRAPMETECRPEEREYMEAIRRAGKRRKLLLVRNLALVLLVLAVIGLMGYLSHVKRHRTTEMVTVALTQEEAKELYPELILTEAEIRLGEIIFTLPPVASRPHKGTTATIPCEEMREYLSEVVPADTEVTVNAQGTYGDEINMIYFVGDEQIRLSFLDRDKTGYVDRITKLVYFSREGELPYQFYTAECDSAMGTVTYSKTEKQTRWYDFLIGD